MTKQEEFIREIAEYLGGANQARMSIGLELKKPEAIQWAKIRNASPLFGYPSVDEAEKQLREWLWPGTKYEGTKV